VSIGTLALLLRMCCCSVVALLAAAKLVRLPGSGADLWVPASALKRYAGPLVAVAGVLELAFATLALLNPVAWLLSTIALLLGLGLCAYGTASIRATGSCGCGGLERRHRAVRSLWGRNLAVFGGIAVGCAFGPTTDELVAASGESVAWAAMLPAVVTGAAVVYRLASTGWPSGGDRVAWAHWRLWRSLTSR
jgi:hypothetical protein